MAMDMSGFDLSGLLAMIGGGDGRSEKVQTAKKQYEELKAEELALVEGLKEKVEGVVREIKDLEAKIGHDRFMLVVGGLYHRANETGLALQDHEDCLGACLLTRVAEVVGSHSLHAEQQKQEAGAAD